MTGYDPFFLGKDYPVPLPRFDDTLAPHVLTAEDMPRTKFEDGTYTNYIHFSIATNKTRRQPIVVALYVARLSDLFS